MKKILFVCTGNTCRSSMAAGIARKLLADRGIKDIEVLSAGTAAEPGAPASPEAVAAMAEAGVDISGHRTVRLTPELVRSADLILTMTRGHQRQVLQMVPEAQDKVHVLKEFVYPLEERSRAEVALPLLQEKLQQIEAAFDREHEAEISALQAERTALLQRLDEIDSRLEQLAEQRWQACARERAELEELEEIASPHDIIDPFGFPLEAYRDCGRQLMLAVRTALDRLLGGRDSANSGGAGN
jgi:protein-tyrosine phosphatase